MCVVYWFSGVFHRGFCKFSRLVCSVKCLYVESIFITTAMFFMEFNPDYLQFPSASFLKTLCSCSTIAKVKHIGKFKTNLPISFFGIVVAEYLKICLINLPSNFDMFFLYRPQISTNLVTGECVLKSLTFSGIVGSHLNNCTSFHTDFWHFCFAEI